MLFQQKAKAYMEEIWAKGKTPILVGGTGFYINALLYDNDFTETENDTSYREECYKLAKEQGPEVLFERLKEVDPEYAEIMHANNVKRVTRALEYHYLTGQKFSEHNAEQKEKETPYDAAVIILNMEREKLYERIELRIDLMMQEGLLEEVKSLLDKGYTPDLVSMQGIGYKEFIPYFNGECTLEEAVIQLKTNTRRFAKRQLTWFRRQIEGLWVDMDQSDGDKVMENVLDYLKQKEIL
jgi:tRNA dimethylallyltransferase